MKHGWQCGYSSSSAKKHDTIPSHQRQQKVLFIEMYVVNKKIPDGLQRMCKGMPLRARTHDPGRNHSHRLRSHVCRVNTARTKRGMRQRHRPKLVSSGAIPSRRRTHCSGTHLAHTRRGILHYEATHTACSHMRRLAHTRCMHHHHCCLPEVADAILPVHILARSHAVRCIHVRSVLAVGAFQNERAV